MHCEIPSSAELPANVQARWQYATWHWAFAMPMAEANQHAVCLCTDFTQLNVTLTLFTQVKPSDITGANKNSTTNRGGEGGLRSV